MDKKETDIRKYLYKNVFSRRWNWNDLSQSNCKGKPFSFAVWVSHGHLWTTVEGTISLTRCLSLLFLRFSTRKSPRASYRCCVPEPSRALSGVWVSSLLVPKVYLEPSRTSTMRLICKSRQRFLAINYFCKKNSIVDVRLDSE